LHRDCAADRGRSAAEDHHQPVTEVLDLATADLVDRLAQEGEVLAAELVRRDRPELRRQSRRTDEVREEHGHGLY